MADANLILHAGAKRVSRDELAAVPCPEAEGRWVPVSHSRVVDYAEKALTDAGYAMEKMDLGLSKDQQKLFGTFTLAAPLSPGVSLAVGIRSSTDKSISLQWCAGSRVFCCDNLSFSSEIVIARKHTTHGVTRYQEAICRAVKGLGDYGRVEADRIARMKATELNDERAESILLRAYEMCILSAHTLPTAIAEWRSPSFPDLEVKNVWRLFNAVTFALGKKAERNPQAHAAATIKLGGLLVPTGKRVALIED